MKTHGEIDERSLALARAVVAKIEADPTRAGISMARETCRRWRKRQQLPIVSEWMHILEKPWEVVREALLEESEHGQQLRQNSPFCRTLSPKERWAVYRRFSSDAATGS